MAEDAEEDDEECEEKDGHPDLETQEGMCYLLRRI